MNFTCPDCKRALDVQRANRRLCSSCNSTLPRNLLIAESGLATLAQEEASAGRRRQAFRSLTPRQTVIANLRNLDPGSSEFYSTAAAYFRRQSRPNRTYGLFFIFLGVVSLILCVIHWRERRLLALLAVPCYLFSGALGLPVAYHASGILRHLPRKPNESLDHRLSLLRKVALNYRWDPVGALVLERIDGLNKRA
jgi:hypothetical protein